MKKLSRVRIAIILAAVLGVIAIYFLAQQPTANFVYDDNVVVKVGDSEITAQQVNKQYDKLPQQLKENITRDDVLNAMVDQELILQKANSRGITVTDAEITAYIEQVKLAYQIDDIGLEKQLSDLNYTMKDYTDSLRDELMTSKLLNQELKLNETKVSDAEIDAFISARPEFQDFFEEGADAVAQLKARVKLELIQEKQKKLITDYIASLRTGANIGGSSSK